MKSAKSVANLRKNHLKRIKTFASTLNSKSNRKRNAKQQNTPGPLNANSNKGLTTKIKYMTTKQQNTPGPLNTNSNKGLTTKIKYTTTKQQNTPGTLNTNSNKGLTTRIKHTTTDIKIMKQIRRKLKESRETFSSWTKEKSEEIPIVISYLLSKD